MASGVTYNGVPSAGGGNIFKDVSFWVAQRVPTRDMILGHIRVGYAPADTMRANAVQEQWRCGRGPGEASRCPHRRPCEKGRPRWLMLVEVCHRIGPAWHHPTKGPLSNRASSRRPQADRFKPTDEKDKNAVYACRRRGLGEVGALSWQVLYRQQDVPGI